MREAGKGDREGKKQVQGVHCGTAKKETDLVVRSCIMSPEGLYGTLHLGRVYFRDMGIYLIALSHLLYFIGLNQRN